MGKPDLLPPKIRSWIYALVTAAGPILAFYGYVEDTEWTLWLGFIGTFLGSSTALAHRPTGQAVQAKEDEKVNAAVESVYREIDLSNYPPLPESPTSAWLDAPPEDGVPAEV